MADAATTPMVFTDRFDHSTDGQYRVQVPSKWRRKGVANETFFLELREHKTAGWHLRVMPMTEVVRLSNQLNRLGEAGGDVDDDKRALASEMPSVNLDGSGKITLPEKLATAAGIGKNAAVKLTGAFGFFEIWNEGDHLKVLESDKRLREAARKKALTATAKSQTS